MTTAVMNDTVEIDDTIKITDTINNYTHSVIDISEFKNGAAEKIFDDVEADKLGIKAVVKDGVAKCILLSPEKYVKLSDKLFDAELCALAEERMKNFDLKTSKTYTQEEIDRMFGITEEDLANVGDVELEIE